MNFFPYGTLAEIAQEIRSKNVSPVELVGLHLKRIEALQPKLNAFVHLDPEGALQQAGAAENLVLRAAQYKTFRRARLLAGALGVQMDKGIQFRLQHHGAFKMEFDDFDGGDILGSNILCDFR